MPIDFVCPKCGTDLETPEGTAGAVTHCPTCGVALIVPGDPAPADDNSPSPPAPPPAPSPAPIESSPVESPPVESSPARDEVSSSSDGLLAANSESSQDVSLAAPLRSDGGLIAWLTAPVDPTASNEFQVARPSPRSFSTAAALAFGARLVQRQLIPFSWTNLGVVALLATAVLLALATRFSPYFWIALAVWVFIAVPPAMAGTAALALRAARGRAVSTSYLRPPRGRVIRVWTYFVAWASVMLAAVAPPMIAAVVAWNMERRVEAVGLAISSLLWTMFVGARLGWFPFIFHDRPKANFSEMLSASATLSRGHTFDLMRLSMLAFSAIVGTNIAVFVIGWPLAMGFAGAAYVLLARDARLRSRDG